MQLLLQLSLAGFQRLQLRVLLAALLHQLKNAFFQQFRFSLSRDQLALQHSRRFFMIGSSAQLEQLTRHPASRISTHSTPGRGTHPIRQDLAAQFREFLPCLSQPNSESFILFRHLVSLHLAGHEQFILPFELMPHIACLGL